MNERNGGGMTWRFWVIGVIALVWNVLGALNFVVQMNPEMLTVYGEAERAIIESRPIWATIGFAFAVFAGSIGGLLLLLRNSAAYYLFVISLLGVLVTMVHTLGVDALFSTGQFIGVILMPIFIAAYLVWYAKQAIARGWIL